MLSEPVNFTVTMRVDGPHPMTGCRRLFRYRSAADVHWSVMLTLTFGKLASSRVAS